MKRLDFLASLLNGFDVVLDIGTDHGLLLKKALDKKYIKQGIASDFRIKPLMVAKKTLINYNVSFYLADGFSNITSNYDAAVIAGMGVYTIISILEKAPLKDITYFIQANSKNEVLRKELIKCGFMIIDEFVVFEKFYYVIMKVKRGHMNLSLEDLVVGPYLKTKENRRDYYLNEIKKLQKINTECDFLTKEQNQLLINYFQKYL